MIYLWAKVYVQKKSKHLKEQKTNLDEQPYMAVLAGLTGPSFNFLFFTFHALRIE